VSWQVNGTITPQPGDECNPTTVSQDTAGRRITCTVSNTFRGEYTVMLDKTPPAGVVATPARPPDSAGWYTAPVPITWSTAQPDTSGIAACTTMTYAGPDGPSLAPAGTCRDRAGNVSAPVTFPLAYDATPPALSDVGATVTGATATVRWTPGADVVATSVVRQGGGAVDVPAGAHEAADGPLAPGIAYTWTVTVRDAAGNAASATATAAVPKADAKAAATSKSASRRAPVIRWRAARNADYYNIQLLRNGRKVLSAWPTRPRYTLRRTWRYHGRTHRLAAGVYRYYVWAGYGPRAARRYGRLLAHGRVRVRTYAPPRRAGGQ
jgi:hypothetical protein